LIGSAGLILGVFLTRLYYQRLVRNVTLGQVIEYSIIQNNIQEIDRLSEILNSTLSDMRIQAESLRERILESQDIEKEHKQEVFTETNLLELEAEAEDEEDISDIT
jgi:hypothetical protein